MKTYFRKLLEKIFAAQMRQIIAKHQPTIIAVTGSVGKTSAKLAIATVLSQVYRVRWQEGNYNAPISVPFIFLNRPLPNIYNPFGWLAAWLHGRSLLHGAKPFDVVVVELGTDAPGDIAYYENLLQPDIAVVTAVSEEHMEFFADLNAVAAEELAVHRYAKRLVVNADDIDRAYMEKYIPKTTLVNSYGFERAEYRLATRRLQHGMRVAVQLGEGGEVAQATVSLVASHSAKAVAAAVAVADLLHMPLEEISAGMAAVTAPSGRMQLLHGKYDSVLLDDTYNASPLAVVAALKTLYEQPGRHKIAILGQMNELGTLSASAHKKIGQLCDPEKLLAVVTIGKDANSYLAAAAEKRGCKVLRCESPYAAGVRVEALLKKDTVVLAKGSQNGVFAEEALKPLLNDPKDESKLVRQSKQWMSRKQTQFLDWAKDTSSSS